MIDSFTFVNGRVGGGQDNLIGDQGPADRQVLPVGPVCPLDAAGAAQLAIGFNALADPVRLRLLSMLAASPEGEVHFCDFVQRIGNSQPTISHHMKILAGAGLVQGERRSKWIYYSLDRGRLASLRAAIDT